MQIRSPPFWLMIVSRAMAVLPVERSPMMSSRWPRPIGIMASIALMPVWTGWFDALAEGHAGGDALDRAGPRGGDRALAVDRVAERVDDAADERVADGHLDDAAGRADLVAFLDVDVVAEDDGADGLLFEVQGDAHLAVGELQQLRVAWRRRARGYGRRRRRPRSPCRRRSRRRELPKSFDLLPQDRGNLFSAYCHCGLPLLQFAGRPA